MAKKTLSPAVELAIERRLAQTSWRENYPDRHEMMTAYRAAHAATAAQADLARWGVGGQR